MNINIVGFFQIYMDLKNNNVISYSLARACIHIKIKIIHLSHLVSKSSHLEANK